MEKNKKGTRQLPDLSELRGLGYSVYYDKFGNLIVRKKAKAYKKAGSK